VSPRLALRSGFQRRRFGPGRPRLITAWVIAVAFSAIAALSFAVDQSMTLAVNPARQGKIELQILALCDIFHAVSPGHLEQWLSGTGAGHSAGSSRAP
jgi:hypothetical protein